jgi:hypothetical protein
MARWKQPVTADCQFAPLVAISIRVNGEQWLTGLQRGKVTENQGFGRKK